MQGIVYGFGEFSANTMHLYKIVNAGPIHTLQATKLTQQLSAPLRTETRNLLKLRCTACLRPLLTVTCDGETMRFIPNLLYQEQCR